MTESVTKTFFLPEEVERRAFTLPADIYNLAHTLLARSEFDCVFVPIRSLQYLGVITHSEIVFVDTQAYAFNQEQGGRLIMLAWKFLHTGTRDSLQEPVASPHYPTTHSTRTLTHGWARVPLHVPSAQQQTPEAVRWATTPGDEKHRFAMKHPFPTHDRALGT